jgi:hypothetical protein
MAITGTTPSDAALEKTFSSVLFIACHDAQSLHEGKSRFTDYSIQGAGLNIWKHRMATVSARPVAERERCWDVRIISGAKESLGFAAAGLCHSHCPQNEMHQAAGEAAWF